MQKGAALAVDLARILAVEMHEVIVVETIVQVGMRQAFPAAPNADDIEADFGRRAINDGLDHRVQAGNIAAPGQICRFSYSPYSFS